MISLLKAGETGIQNILMINKKIILVIFVFISNSLFCQNKEYKISIDTTGRFSHWSISIDGGEIVPFSTFGNYYKNSISAGFQLTYLTTHRFGFFFNPQYNFLNARDVNYSGTSGYVELVAGAKMYFGKFPEIFFAEAGLWRLYLYIFNRQFYKRTFAGYLRLFRI